MERLHRAGASSTPGNVVRSFIRIPPSTDYRLPRILRRFGCDSNKSYYGIILHIEAPIWEPRSHHHIAYDLQDVDYKYVVGTLCSV